MIGIEQFKRIFVKAKAYKEVFKKEDNNVTLVIADLAKECMAFQSTMSNNPQDTAFNEGKRTVFLYILRNSNIDLFELQKLVEQERQSE